MSIPKSILLKSHKRALQNLKQKLVDKIATVLRIRVQELEAEGQAFAAMEIDLLADYVSNLKDREI